LIKALIAAFRALMSARETNLICTTRVAAARSTSAGLVSESSGVPRRLVGVRVPTASMHVTRRIVSDCRFDFRGDGRNQRARPRIGAGPRRPAQGSQHDLACSRDIHGNRSAFVAGPGGGIESLLDQQTNRHGDFALQHMATMDANAPKMTVVVVPGSGSGDLQGIGGTFMIKIADGLHSYEFD